MYEFGSESAGEPLEGGAADRSGLEVWWRAHTGVAQLAALKALPVGSASLGRIESIDLDGLSADDAVTVLQELQRFASHVAGVEAELRSRVTDKVVAEVQVLFDDDAERLRLKNVERVEQGLLPLLPAPAYVCAEQVAFSEITAALRMSPRTGEARILEAQELTNAWRPLLDAMLAGEITIDHTRAVGREMRNLPGHGNGDPEVEKEYRKSCAKVLAQVVPFAVTHSPGETARKARDLVTAVDPAGARARRRRAAEQDHGVFLNPLEPGTSEIRAVMPTAYAEAIHQAVRMLAKDPRFEVSDGCITKGQRQAAALVALTLGDPGSVAEVTGPVHEAKLKVHINVLVPLETITSSSDACGRIGNTPATADEVRDLLAAAAESSMIRRLVTDSAGCILDAGRSHYLASDIQKLVIKLRDGYCRFPGCDARAERCEIDHAHAYGSGGHTDQCNLGCLCQFHHQMKTHAGWRIILSRLDGTCRWRSPLGRIYDHTPPDLTPPRLTPAACGVHPPGTTPHTAGEDEPPF